MYAELPRSPICIQDMCIKDSVCHLIPLGPTLQYFEPAILGEIYPEPTWLSNWDDFRAELEMNFGPFNNAAQAEIELEKIVMKDHH